MDNSNFICFKKYVFQHTLFFLKQQIWIILFMLFYESSINETASCCCYFLISSYKIVWNCSLLSVSKRRTLPLLTSTWRSLIGLSDYSDYSKTGFTATGEDYWRKLFLDPMCTLYLNMYEYIFTLKIENMRSTLESK